jgi:hypothetical protein
LEVALFLKSIDMLAKLMRSGWALRPPVPAEMSVLSEDKITPRSVAPAPSFVYEMVHKAYMEEIETPTCMSQA